jgi:hypothetical protein
LLDVGDDPHKINPLLFEALGDKVEFIEIDLIVEEGQALEASLCRRRLSVSV